jgi:hypothetical protein
MSRYFTRPRATLAEDLDVPFSDFPATMDVIVQKDTPVDTGLVSADGHKIYRQSDRQPVGFCR